MLRKKKTVYFFGGGKPKAEQPCASCLVAKEQGYMNDTYRGARAARLYHNNRSVQLLLRAPPAVPEGAAS